MRLLLLLLPGLAALAFGCGGPAPSARLPVPPPSAATAAPPAADTAAPGSAVPGSAAAATAAAPSACAPRAARAVKVATRSGSSVALVEDSGRRLLYIADEDHGAALRLEHPTLDSLAEPTDPPTLRAARLLLLHARSLRAALRSYRASVRQSLCSPLHDDLPF